MYTLGSSLLSNKNKEAPIGDNHSKISNFHKTQNICAGLSVEVIIYTYIHTHNSTVIIFSIKVIYNLSYFCVLFQKNDGVEYHNKNKKENNNIRDHQKQTSPIGSLNDMNYNSTPTTTTKRKRSNFLFSSTYLLILLSSSSYCY